jgi:hypothetical protein
MQRSTNLLIMFSSLRKYAGYDLLCRRGRRSECPFHKGTNMYVLVYWVIHSQLLSLKAIMFKDDVVNHNTQSHWNNKITVTWLWIGRGIRLECLKREKVLYRMKQKSMKKHGGRCTEWFWKMFGAPIFWSCFHPFASKLGMIYVRLFILRRYAEEVVEVNVPSIKATI